MTSEQKQQIHLLREKGYGYATIAEALGLTKNQVSAYCRRNNLSGTKAERTVSSRPDSDCCLCCGKPLTQTPGRKPIKFCSNECRVKWWNSHQDMVNKKAIYSFTCACCGKEFTAYGNAKRKYCSHACYITDRFGTGSTND
ncbi:RNA polymerase subunit sigma-70 [Bariatricus sp. HCP3S3_E12]|uniref:RNA polymerase subunit sigma-70 n=1 Tax=Absicoccus porci TaxID=2486576 RepID=A0A3N0I3U2_9FIRM|nr:RNA polymerase subunit sigma-70 [Absicoccus porci]